MNQYIKLIHGYDIYKNFDFHKYPCRINGWNVNPPLYEMLIIQTKPKIIIELGSWLGASAIAMAQIIKKNNLDTTIICIDTWLGSSEFIGLHESDASRSLMSAYGYPNVYYQFLSNVLHNQVSDIIVPFPNTFQHACDWLLTKDIEAQLIYSDGDNAIASVFNDLTYAWPLLSINGIVFGDDLNHMGWPGIKMGLNEFCLDYNVRYKTIKEYDNFWMIEKKHLL